VPRREHPTSILLYPEKLARICRRRSASSWLRDRRWHLVDQACRSADPALEEFEERTTVVLRFTAEMARRARDVRRRKLRTPRQPGGEQFAYWGGNGRVRASSPPQAGEGYVGGGCSARRTDARPKTCCPWRCLRVCRLGERRSSRRVVEAPLRSPSLSDSPASPVVRFKS
jgi:hypothetical protein